MQRFYQILPGALAWLTIFAMLFFSWKLPVAVAIFIILFDIYWLLKTVYLSFHLRAAFKEMKKNESIDWMARLEASSANTRINGIDSWQDIRHLIVLPMYQEPYEVVRESLESLASTSFPKESLLVVLATEERAGEEAREVAARAKQEFADTFGEFLVTVHPADIPGELAGKGSNEAWATQAARKEIIKKRQLLTEQVIVSVFDVDTQVPSQYFARLAWSFLQAENPLRAIYQPIPLFVNNIFQAPAMARVVAFSATFWQMMQQARPERLTTFSSQSIPLTVLEDVGYWDTDIVSEDSRIFWQAYLEYDGDFRVVPLKYSVAMDANVAPGFWKTMKNIYLQQRRWGWGVENIPYMLKGFRKNKNIPLRKKAFWTFTALEGFHSWATNALMIFALGWLPLILGGEAFNYSLLSYSLPRVTRFIIGLSMVGVATSAVMSVALLPPKPDWFRPRHYLLYLLEWLLLPITLIVFGAIPGLEAQTRLMFGGKWKLGFWVTPKGRYSKGEGGAGGMA